MTSCSGMQLTKLVCLVCWFVRRLPQPGSPCATLLGCRPSAKRRDQGSSAPEPERLLPDNANLTVVAGGHKRRQPMLDTELPWISDDGVVPGVVFLQSPVPSLREAQSRVWSRSASTILSYRGTELEVVTMHAKNPENPSGLCEIAVDHSLEIRDSTQVPSPDLLLFQQAHANEHVHWGNLILFCEDLSYRLDDPWIVPILPVVLERYLLHRSPDLSAAPLRWPIGGGPIRVSSNSTRLPLTPNPEAPRAIA